MGRHSDGEDRPADTLVPDRAHDPSAGDDQHVGLPHHRHHRTLWIATGIFWLLALVVGLAATLVGAARVGCVASASGLACTNTGSALAVLLVLAVILTVGVSTVYAFEDRDEPKRWLRHFGLGTALLAILLVLARILTRTL